MLIFGLGFFAQLLFFSRSLVQWFKSEKAGKIVSPVLFWQISLLAAVLMMVYGILRKDPAIILGQLITFYIYIRNLQIQREWKKIPRYFRYFISSVPLGCGLWIFISGNHNLKEIVGNDNITTWLMYFGIVAQVIFTFRFVYQWIVSERNHNSWLPPGFWYFSLTGASMTLVYAALRLDPVLFLSNLGGLFMYARNLYVHYTGKGIFDILPFDITAIRKKWKNREGKNRKNEA